MMPRLSRCLAPLALACSMLGCVDDQEMFYVAYTAGIDPETCQIDTGVSLVSDVIDVSVGGSAGLFLVLRNVQNQNGQSNTNIDDDGELALKHAEVSFSVDGGGPIGEPYEVAVAGDSLNSGEEISTFVPVPAGMTSSFAGSVGSTVVMSVVIVADRTDQAGGGKLGEVRSREYTFPFSVCSGCLPCTTPACGLSTASACPEEEESDTTDTTTGP